MTGPGAPPTAGPMAAEPAGQSIASRLMFGLTLTVGMSALLAAAILAGVAVRAGSAAIDRDVDSAVLEAEQILERPLWDLDFERATQLAQAFALDPRVARFSYTESTTGTSQTIIRVASSDTAQRARTVSYRGRSVGTVQLAFSREIYRQGVWKQVRSALLVSLFAMVAAIAGVRLLVGRILRRPLDDLSRTLRGYGDEPPSGAPAQPAMRYVEFQAVGAVLETMGDRIARQLRDLHDANERLAREAADRRVAEASALRDRNMLSHVIDTVPMAVFWKDRSGRYLGGNAVFASYTGAASVEDVLGRTDDDLLLPAPAAAARATDLEVIEGRQPRNRYVHEHGGHDGVVRWLETIKVPLAESDGDVIGVLGVARDMTQDRQRDEQILHGQKLEAVGQLAGGIAHDFNNILGAVLLEVELLDGDLRAGPGDEAQRDSLESIRTAVNRAARLTRQLLLFSRRQPLDMRTVDLNEVIRELLQMLTRVIGEHITVRFEPSTRPVTVEADSGMLEQVILNLCVNSRDAMPAGGVLTISTSVMDASVDDGTDAPYACLQVTDTGIGMSDDTRRRIFEPFFTTKEVSKGSGLGLATTHGIVAQHHGWIDVDSTEGEGTSFHVCLPLSSAAPAATPATARQVPTPRAVGSERVLVLEDEPQLRSILVRSLRRLGYLVVEAGDSEEADAIWVAEAGTFDLLLTDIVIPGPVSGLELSRRFRTQCPGLAVVVMSGYSPELTRDADGDLPPHFLGKPFTIPAMSTLVRRALDERA